MRSLQLSDVRSATSETVRDINRRLVLNLIRRHEPLSRADLSRHSGLTRSTVSLIAEELISDRWIVEGALRDLPRGRKPTLLHLNHERAGIIGVDIRPVRTYLALATLDCQFIAQDSLPTGANPKQFVRQLVRRVEQLIRSRPEMDIEGIGLALPGRVDLKSHRLTFAPNLGWRDVDFKTPLESATGLPVEVENAANACALAELWSEDHGDRLTDLITVTVSEGIGVGMILNGRLVRGPTGLAGEFGHVTLDEDGPLCSCGNRGCWEAFASNQAVVRYYCESTHGAGHGCGNGRAPSFADILRLSEEGDREAQAALDRSAHFLGAGIAMLMTGFAPQLVVVFGEVTRAWDRVGPIINGLLQKRLCTAPATRLVRTDPSSHPRLRGTIALVMQKHFGSPWVG